VVFRVMSDQELALLDDNQRMQYEKALDLHQQRLTFVEQLEKLENVTLEPYKPKLKPVFVIGKIDAKSFKNPEYTLVLHEPVVIPEPQINPFAKPELTKPVLPILPKRPSVSIKQREKLKRVKPELPLISKPTIVGKHIKKHEVKPLNLPSSAKLDITTEPFKKLEKLQAVLPALKNPTIKTAKQLGLARAEWQRKPFSKPRQPDIELPVVIKPGISISLSMNVEKSVPKLPKHKKLDIQIKEFIKPDLPKPELPTITKASITAKDFRKPPHSNANLPTVVKACFEAKEFIPPERSKANICMIKTLPVKVREYVGIKRGFPQLPKTRELIVPDADSILNTVLSFIGAEYKVLEG